jgi:hypothetical protein
MSTEDFQNRLHKRFPYLAQAEQALDEYGKRQPITARCPICEGLMTVTDLPEVGTIWVTCPEGCTKFHLNYKPTPPDTR